MHSERSIVPENDELGLVAIRWMLENDAPGLAPHGRSEFIQAVEAAVEAEELRHDLDRLLVRNRQREGNR